MTSHAAQHGYVHQPADQADAHHGMGRPTAMALSATLHCLTGCAIGEIAGLIIGTAAGLSNAATIAISIALAFFFGYSLSVLPLLKSGLALRAALTVVLAADTLSWRSSTTPSWQSCPVPWTPAWSTVSSGSA